MHEAMVEQKKPAVSILRRLQSFSVIRCTSIVHIGEMILYLIQVQLIMSRPELPSPVLDNDAIRRLCRFAIKHSFQWPPVARSVVVPDARRLLEQRLGQARWKSDVTSDMRLWFGNNRPRRWSVDTRFVRTISRLSWLLACQKMPVLLCGYHRRCLINFLPKRVI